MTERIVAGRLAVAPRSARLSDPTRVPHAGAAAVATLARLTLMVPPERAIPVGNLQQVVAVGGRPAPLAPKAEARS